MLYRVFPSEPGAGPSDEGGPLHVARWKQGWSRHDAVDLYGALYASRSPVSAVAELVKRYRGAELGPEHLVASGGRRYCLAGIDDGGLTALLDLDDPRELAARGLRPSRVATRERDVTQVMARRLFEESHDGFEWWSTLEASWINVTLFAERSAPRLHLADAPVPLTLDHPDLAAAADALGIDVAS